MGFLVGVVWALLLILPGWLMAPHGKEQRDVAAVYLALAAELRSAGSSGFASQRQALTGALNTAYDTLLSAKSTATGQSRERTRLVAVLNASHLMAEAATTLCVAGTRPPPMIIGTVEQLADSFRNGTPPPAIPPPWADDPAALALRDAMADTARVLARDWSPEHRTREGLSDRRRDGALVAESGRRRARPARLGRWLKRSFGRLAAAFDGGTLSVRG